MIDGASRKLGPPPRLWNPTLAQNAAQGWVTRQGPRTSSSIFEGATSTLSLATSPDGRLGHARQFTLCALIMLLDDVVEGFRIDVRQIRRRGLTYVFAIAYFTALAIVPLISLWMFDPSRFRAFWAKVSLPESGVTVILALSGVFVLLSQLMLRYLRADSQPRERRSYFESLDFSKRLGKLEQAAGGLTPKIREELVATLKADAAGQMATEFEAHFRRSYAPAMEV